MTDVAERFSGIDPNAPEAIFARALIQAGKLSEQDASRALTLAQSQASTFTSMLTKLGLMAERDLAAAYAQAMGIAQAGPADFPQEPVEVGEISARFLRQKKIVPLSLTERDCVVAVADPLDEFAINALRLAVGVEVTIRIADPSLIDAAIERYYGDETLDAAAPGGGAGADSSDLDVERLRDLASEAPVIRLVNRLIASAVDQRASDIHIEPFEKKCRVRFRIDGELREVETLPDNQHTPVVSRIKIMARLDIAQRRLPQDGRARIIVRGKEVDLRISIVPVLHGETVVLRVLDRDAVSLDFDSLGVSARPKAFLQDMIVRPNGIYIVTGPTGSGKTTTLYAAMKAIDSERRKVLTVEDPIEYQLDGINQLQVRPNIGLSFADALRAFLRQDPDVILVGEIRDGETAGIAAQAALTGHLVLSTLHTNDAASAVTRLADMGVERFLLSATLGGIVAQRLLRCLCPSCREPYNPKSELRERFELDRTSRTATVRLFRPVGCSACKGRGYLGRTLVMETMTISERIRSLILQSTESREIRKVAIEEGMIPMRDDGLLKALDGTVSLEEVIRTMRDV